MFLGFCSAKMNSNNYLKRMLIPFIGKKLQLKTLQGKHQNLKNEYFKKQKKVK